MKLHGYCTRCRRIRLVNVSVYIPHATPTGICDDCQEREDKRTAALWRQDARP